MYVCKLSMKHIQTNGFLKNCIEDKMCHEKENRLMDSLEAVEEVRRSLSPRACIPRLTGCPRLRALCPMQSMQITSRHRFASSIRWPAWCILYYRPSPSIPLLREVTVSSPAATAFLAAANGLLSKFVWILMCQGFGVAVLPVGDQWHGRRTGSISFVLLNALVYGPWMTRVWSVSQAVFADPSMGNDMRFSKSLVRICWDLKFKDSIENKRL